MAGKKHCAKGKWHMNGGCAESHVNDNMSNVDDKVAFAANIHEACPQVPLRCDEIAPFGAPKRI